MTVRIATVEDASNISALCDDVQNLHAHALPELYKPASPDTFPAGKVRELMTTADHVFFLAEVDGEPAGYVYAELQRQPETPFCYATETVYVHHISVRPQCRRSGIGVELMDAVKAWAKERSVSTVKLHTCAFNETAIAFFERSGFDRLAQSMTVDISVL